MNTREKKAGNNKYSKWKYSASTPDAQAVPLAGSICQDPTGQRDKAM